MPAVEPDELERDEQGGDILAQADADLRAFLTFEGIDDDQPAGDTLALDVWIDKRLAVLAAIEERIHQNNEAARLRIEMIERWRDEQNASLERQRDYLVRLLEDAARAYPYPKNSKSRALPFGTVGVKNQPEKLKVEDMNRTGFIGDLVIREAPAWASRLLRANRPPRTRPVAASRWARVAGGD